MSIHNLEALFEPASVAVVGASNRPRSVGQVVTRNLLLGGFGGPVLPVNPKAASVAGVLAYPDVASLPLSPDLAVVCTPPDVVPEVVGQLARRGTRAAIVLTAGLEQPFEGGPGTLKGAMLAAAHGPGAGAMRILGPNCVGLISSGARLNASFAHISARPGSIAFVSQSGALCTAVLDWADARGIGFSHFVSLGEASDVDFGDLLDYLSQDAATRAVLLYIESIREARKLMSAARAVARTKTVIAVKAGRRAEGARAAASHTGAMAGQDEVYDAALRRAGILRVIEVEELFDAVETLARAQPGGGDGLVIVTNGGGPGVLAVDALVASGGELPALAEDLVAELDRHLPPTWSRANPIDLIGDAGPERYEATLRALLARRGEDGLLVLNVPTALTSSLEAAEATIRAVRGSRRRVFTCWLGGTTAEPARRAFAEAGLPTFESPEDAVRAFMNLVQYRRNQIDLAQTPRPLPEGSPRRQEARSVIAAALGEGRTLLTEIEAKHVLACYGIPCVETRLAKDPDEAARIAAELGFPVAVKVVSPQITHKSDVGGVQLGLTDAEQVRSAARGILERVAAGGADRVVTGFAVQPMARVEDAHELIVGSTTDPVFGPVILFGRGGVAVEALADKALALPPVNAHLARRLIDQTRVARLLRGYRGRPPVDHAALELLLVRLSELLADLGTVREVDMNPVLAGPDGALALDARMVVGPGLADGAERFAIRPYPTGLEETVTLRSGREVLLRPIRPEDEAAHQELFSRLDRADIRFRFFGLIKQIPHADMARYTQIDYDREMAFIAVDSSEGAPRTVGVVRLVEEPPSPSVQFAMIVRSDLKGKGLGRALLEKAIRYARARGYRAITGQTLADNVAMRSLARALGFGVSDSGREVVDLRLTLDAAPAVSYVLRDGRPALLRPLRPDDRERLVQGMRELSPESRYQRFMSAVTTLGEHELAHLTAVDQVTHLAWIALDPNRPGQPALGVARCVRLPETPTTAEVAVAVVDAAQDRGLGTILLAKLAAAARRVGIDTWRALVLADNRRMLELFDQLGARIGEREGAAVRVDIPLPADPTALPDSPAGQVFRAIAQDETREAGRG